MGWHTPRFIQMTDVAYAVSHAPWSDAAPFRYNPMAILTVSGGTDGIGEPWA